MFGRARRDVCVYRTAHIGWTVFAWGSTAPEGLSEVSIAPRRPDCDLDRGGRVEDDRRSPQSDRSCLVSFRSSATARARTRADGRRIRSIQAAASASEAERSGSSTDLRARGLCSRGDMPGSYEEAGRRRSLWMPRWNSWAVSARSGGLHPRERLRGAGREPGGGGARPASAGRRPSHRQVLNAGGRLL